MTPREHFQEYTDAAYEAIWFSDTDPDKAQEFLNQMEIHHQNFKSSMQAEITRVRYPKNEMAT